MSTDPDLLAPSIDPETKKLGIRTVKGRNAAGTRTEIQVRHFPTVVTDEPPERLEKLKKNVEFRCPVMNLMRAADVQLNVTWQAQPAADFSG